MDGLTRAQAIKEVMKMHSLDRKTAASLVDEMIRLSRGAFQYCLEERRRPIGLLKDAKEN